MAGLGYAKNGDDFWELDGETLDMSIYVPDWLKAYGPPLTQQLRDAGFNASFDTSPGLNTPTQTGEQASRSAAKDRLGSRAWIPTSCSRSTCPSTSGRPGARSDLVGYISLAKRGV